MAKVKLLTLFASVALAANTASACPLIGGMVDYNCDGIHKVVVVGDSIAKGRGDLLNNNQGGYVLRLQKKFKKSKFVNLGKPGYSTLKLFSELKSNLSKKRANAIKIALADADLVFLDAGRNDFFQEITPGMTVNNLERIVDLLRTELSKNGAIAPVIEVATLLPTKRGFQRPFLEEVNSLLLKFSSENLPIGLYFHLFKSDIISRDCIHPDSAGYKQIFNYLRKILVDDIKVLSLSTRPDTDKDGIYDLFEKSKFGTDPKNPDTDGDTLLDGEEVFNLGTDPLTPDI